MATVRIWLTHSVLSTAPALCQVETPFSSSSPTRLTQAATVERRDGVEHDEVVDAHVTTRRRATDRDQGRETLASRTTSPTSTVRGVAAIASFAWSSTSAGTG